MIFWLIVTDVVVGPEWRASEAGGQNRSNDDLMMGGEQFCTTAYLEMIHFSLNLQPPLELQIGPGGFGQNDVTLHSLSIVWRARRLYTKYIRWFWTKRCHIDRRTAVFGPLGAKQGAFLAIKQGLPFKQLLARFCSSGTFLRELVVILT